MAPSSEGQTASQWAQAGTLLKVLQAEIKESAGWGSSWGLREGGPLSSFRSWVFAAGRQRGLSQLLAALLSLKPVAIHGLLLMLGALWLLLPAMGNSAFIEDK